MNTNTVVEVERTQLEEQLDWLMWCAAARIEESLYQFAVAHDGEQFEFVGVRTKTIVDMLDVAQSEGDVVRGRIKPIKFDGGRELVGYIPFKKQAFRWLPFDVRAVRTVKSPLRGVWSASDLWFWGESLLPYVEPQRFNSQVKDRFTVTELRELVAVGTARLFSFDEGVELESVVMRGRDSGVDTAGKVVVFPHTVTTPSEETVETTPARKLPRSERKKLNRELANALRAKKLPRNGEVWETARDRVYAGESIDMVVSSFVETLAEVG